MADYNLKISQTTRENLLLLAKRRKMSIYDILERIVERELREDIRVNKPEYWSDEEYALWNAHTK